MSSQGFGSQYLGPYSDSSSSSDSGSESGRIVPSGDPQNVPDIPDFPIFEDIDISGENMFFKIEPENDQEEDSEPEEENTSCFGRFRESCRQAVSEVPSLTDCFASISQRFNSQRPESGGDEYDEVDGSASYARRLLSQPVQGGDNSAFCGDNTEMVELNVF